MYQNKVSKRNNLKETLTFIKVYHNIINDAVELVEKILLQINFNLILERRWRGEDGFDHHFYS